MADDVGTGHTSADILRHPSPEPVTSANKGLARYAAAHADVFRRVEAVAEVNGKLRVLDLTRVDVRKAIEETHGARALYEGAFAKDYPDETSSGTP